MSKNIWFRDCDYYYIKSSFNLNACFSFISIVSIPQTQTNWWKEMKEKIQMENGYASFWFVSYVIQIELCFVEHLFNQSFTVRSNLYPFAGIEIVIAVANIFQSFKSRKWKKIFFIFLNFILILEIFHSSLFDMLDIGYWMLDVGF